MKKITSLILAVIMIITTLTISSYATSEDIASEITSTTIDLISEIVNEDSDVPVDENTDKTPEDAIVPTNPTDNPEDSEVKNWKDIEYPIKMYFCASANSLTGHVWLYFVNLTDCDIPLGYATLKAGDEMSVGSLRNLRKDGGGTYYNGERMMATISDIDNVRKHTYSLNMLLTPEQVEKVSEKIKHKNSYDLIFNNCGVFAAAIWNSVSEKKVIHVIFPIISIIFILANGGQKGDLKMKPVAIEDCLKQTRDGYKQANIESFRSVSI